jgi:hypothetical protein
MDASDSPQAVSNREASHARGDEKSHEGGQKLKPEHSQVHRSPFNAEAPPLRQSGAPTPKSPSRSPFKQAERSGQPKPGSLLSPSANPFLPRSQRLFGPPRTSTTRLPPGSARPPRSFSPPQPLAPRTLKFSPQGNSHPKASNLDADGNPVEEHAHECAQGTNHV